MDILEKMDLLGKLKAFKADFEKKNENYTWHDEWRSLANVEGMLSRDVKGWLASEDGIDVQA
jgi:hypothetical protein